jgi:hypothetical protein
MGHPGIQERKEWMMTEQDGTEKPVGGWTPPEHRRCGYVHVSGAACRKTPQTGERFCWTHRAWNETDPMYPIKVPLLEDPDSIRLVMSQTVRSMAMGTIPAANGKGMLYGCRMALDLLLFELAREKFRAREGALQGTGCSVQGAGDGEQGPVEGERTAESPVCEHRADMGHPAPGTGCSVQGAGDGEQGPGHREQGAESRAPGVVGDESAVEAPACEQSAQAGPRIVPRFPDLPAQWDQAVHRAEEEVARNVQRSEDECGEEWRERQARPIGGAHPSVRGPARVPIATLRRKDLPFDPMCPPAWDHATMKHWSKEAMAAWFRALGPSVTQLEVREFVRGMWEIPHADAKAGWPEEAQGVPPQECLFWTMNAVEIAAWVKKEIPDMPASETERYAEERVRRMEKAKEGQGVGDRG